ncbi:OmpA family protein, partial [Algibacter sp.]|uniref:OmpA family protein n=1 Tax=Algibacter sp. TaxID=1872428 RepID=UPI003C7106DA
GYFASNRTGGLGSDDIYGFDRIPQINLEGTVYDNVNNEPVNNAIVTLLDSVNKEVATYKTNESGNFAIIIDRDSNYKVTVTKDGFVEKTSSVSSKNLDINVKSINNDFSMQPKINENIVEETVENIAFSPIYYSYNSSKFRNEDINGLENIVNTLLNVYPNMKIKIESYSDSRGPAAYNIKLSEKRVNEAFNYLVRMGISPARIIDYKGYGEEKLINACDDTNNCTEEQHQLNRRTNFIVVNE